jgi:hypothetical protein
MHFFAGLAICEKPGENWVLEARRGGASLQNLLKLPFERYFGLFLGYVSGCRPIEYRGGSY